MGLCIQNYFKIYIHFEFIVEMSRYLFYLFKHSIVIWNFGYNRSVYRLNKTAMLSCGRLIFSKPRYVYLEFNHQCCTHLFVSYAQETRWHITTKCSSARSIGMMIIMPRIALRNTKERGGTTVVTTQTWTGHTWGDLILPSLTASSGMIGMVTTIRWSSPRWRSLWQTRVRNGSEGTSRKNGMK